jgi:hypothetical protein
MYRRSATRSRLLVLCVAWRTGYSVSHPRTSRRSKAMRFIYDHDGFIALMSEVIAILK